VLVFLLRYPDSSSFERDVYSYTSEEQEQEQELTGMEESNSYEEEDSSDISDLPWPIGRIGDVICNYHAQIIFIYLWVGRCRKREKFDWQEAPKFDCPLVRTIFVVLRQFAQVVGEWPENQILIPDWTYSYCN